VLWIDHGSNSYYNDGSKKASSRYAGMRPLLGSLGSG